MSHLPVIKVGFTDTVESIAQFWIDILSKRFTVHRDDSNPDYLFFGDKNFGQNNLSYNNCIKIFYTGENQRPWDYKCHYAITFDHVDSDRHYRLPLYVIFDWDNKRKNVTSIETVNRQHNDMLENKKFCSFVVHNGLCQKRNDFFHKLSKYKQVDSGGPLFNNIGGSIPRGDNAVQEKFKFINQYKFNICFENASHPGYCTEKLFEALLAKTIPIYWGSPTVECDFNTKAFLNWHDYLDDDALIEKIIELDMNDDLYEEMYMEHMFYDYRKPNKYFDMERFLDWFIMNVYKGGGL